VFRVFAAACTAHTRERRARTRHRSLTPDSDARPAPPCAHRQRSQEEALADRPLLSGRPPPMSFFVSMPFLPSSRLHPTLIITHKFRNHATGDRARAVPAGRANGHTHVRTSAPRQRGARNSRCHPRTPRLHAPRPPPHTYRGPRRTGVASVSAGERRRSGCGVPRHEQGALRRSPRNHHSPGERERQLSMADLQKHHLLQ
jgi:hypothetical protein